MCINALHAAHIDHLRASYKLEITLEPLLERHLERQFNFIILLWVKSKIVSATLTENKL